MVSCNVYCYICCSFFFFKHKTVYELRISDWSSDVCSSDLTGSGSARTCAPAAARIDRARSPSSMTRPEHRHKPPEPANEKMGMGHNRRLWVALSGQRHGTSMLRPGETPAGTLQRVRTARSEERRGGNERDSRGRTGWSSGV